MFVLNSDIRIGDFRFSGVNTVEVKRSLHNYTDTAVIKIPSQAKVYVNNQPSPNLEHVAGRVKEGDKVSIKLGYNNKLETEFAGFVVKIGLNMPMEIECEGYSYQMRLKVDLCGHLKKTTVKEMLQIACGLVDMKQLPIAAPLTDIKVVCQEDIPLVDMSLSHVNGLQVIDEIKKITLNTLAIFFIKPNVLWCGFTYTSYVNKQNPFNELMTRSDNGRVSYRLGYNCLKDNGLKMKEVKEPVQVILKCTSATGNVIQSKSGAESAGKKDQVVMNNIPVEKILQKVADEKQYQSNYKGYTGHLTGFLQPYCLPGYAATIVDDRDGSRNGTYMVESTSVSYGVSGARREVEIGPRIGFDPGK